MVTLMACPSWWTIISLVVLAMRQQMMAVAWNCGTRPGSQSFGARCH